MTNLFSISQTLSRVAPSATMAVTQAARELKSAGVDVIGLGAGEPDFDTPDHIKAAAIKAIKDGETNYTNVDGTPELKAAISAKFKRDNNLLYSPAYSLSELKALGEVLLRHPQVMVLTDDIYEHLVYDGFVYATIAQACPELYDRILTMNGVSKAYAMTGWRIGFAGGPEWLIKGMAKVMSQSTSNPCSISQWASAAALNGPHDFLTGWKRAYVARRNFVVGSLNDASSLSCQMPDGAFYAFPDCGGLLGKTSAKGTTLTTDLDVAKAILDEVHVALVPGSAFHASPNLRLSYAADIDTLKIACERIQEFCAAVR